MSRCFPAIFPDLFGVERALTFLFLRFISIWLSFPFTSINLLQYLWSCIHVSDYNLWFVQCLVLIINFGLSCLV